MTPAFAVRSMPRYERLARSLKRDHREFQSAELHAVGVLSTDPLNRLRNHDIKKLKDVSLGDGQYRLAIGRWRFRYDVDERNVVLTYCGLRREDTY